VNLNTADIGGDMYFDLGWGQLEVQPWGTRAAL
jgi:hypothetical protein